MPIYEFKCSKCGKKFEELCFSSRVENIMCPFCGSTEAERVLSVFSSSGLERKLASSCGSTHSGGS